MKVRYVGSDPILQGATAIACDNKPKWFIQLDRYPGGPPVEECNPLDHPLMFGRHMFPPDDWEEVEDGGCGSTCGG